MKPRAPFTRLPRRAVLVLCLLAAAPVGARTFTDREGRKIEAEISGASGANVTLRLENGRNYTIPVTKLSDADQLFVAAWKADPKSISSGSKEPAKASIPADIAYSIEIDANKKRVKKRSSSKDDTGKVTPEDWIYEIELENRSRATLDGLEMSYRIYVDPKASEKINLEDPPKFFGHRSKIETMTNGAKLKVNSETVLLNDLELDGSLVFTDGSRNNLKDSIEGVWIKVWHGDRKVAEFKSNTSVLKEAKWPDDEPAEPPVPDGE